MSVEDITESMNKTKLEIEVQILNLEDEREEMHKRILQKRRDLRNLMKIMGRVETDIEGKGDDKDGE